MNILNFIQNNAPSIIAVIIAVVVMVFAYQNGRSEHVKEVILNLVVKAEEHFGRGTGEIKYAEVVAGIYKVLPSIVLFFLSEKELDDMIEDAVKYMKQCLEGQQGLDISKGDLRDNSTVYPNQDTVGYDDFIEK